MSMLSFIHSNKISSRKEWWIEEYFFVGLSFWMALQFFGDCVITDVDEYKACLRIRVLIITAY